MTSKSSCNFSRFQRAMMFNSKSTTFNEHYDHYHHYHHLN
jgi:hypothetical protein